VRTPSGEQNQTRAIPVRRGLLGALAAVALTTTLSAGCGSQGSTASTARANESALAGTALTPIKNAPILALRNYLGDKVNLASYRGKAVLVTFLYTHCVDVCPVITANLRLALERLGPAARDVQIIAVSVDPRGDTRKTRQLVPS
jgi:protein SCO1/2